MRCGFVEKLDLAMVGLQWHLLQSWNAWQRLEQQVDVRKNDDWSGFPESELRSRMCKLSVYVRRPFAVLSSENESSFAIWVFLSFVRVCPFSSRQWQCEMRKTANFISSSS